MHQLDKLNELCLKKNIVVEIVKPPLYVEPFKVDSENIILIRKEGNSPAPFTPLLGLKKEEEEVSEFELTGSPLQTSLNDSLINLPIERIKMKITQYHNHLPVAYTDAMCVINSYSSSNKPNLSDKELPIWIYCNPEHDGNVLTLLWRESNGNVTRGRACMTSSLPNNQDGFPSLEAMVQKHLQVSKGDKDDISYLVNACYMQDKNNADETEFNINDTEINMDFSWTRPYTFFSKPPYDANATLDINILVGSEATQMWMEIELLKDIGLQINETPEEKEAKLMESMCTRNFTALNSTLRSQVQYFINNGALPGPKENIQNSGMQNGILLLNQIYEEITKGRNTDADLTEILWSVLKNGADPVEVCSCFKLLFREAAAGRFNTGFLPDNNTTVAQVIQGFILRTNIRNVLPRIRKSDGLMLLFELGCLKIQRDYRQIFQRIEISANIFNQISEKLKLMPATTSANREKCIENLVDVHSLLEILLLLRSQLHLEEDSLHNVATSALTTLLSTGAGTPSSLNNIMSDEETLHRNLSLSIPMHPKLLIPLVKGLIPKTWSVYMTSSVKKRQVKTVFHSAKEIFPCGVYDGEQSMSENAKNQVVHYIQVSDKQFSIN